MSMRSNVPFIAGFISVALLSTGQPRSPSSISRKERGGWGGEMITFLILCNYSGLQAALQAFSLIFDSYDGICLFPVLWLLLPRYWLILSWGSAASPTFCFVFSPSTVFISASFHLLNQFQISPSSSGAIAVWLLDWGFVF